MAEQAHQRGCQHHAQGREEKGFDRYGAGLPPVGAEPSVKHDEHEGKGAHVPDQLEVVEVNGQRTVGTKKHAQKNKGQQRGNADSAGDPAQQHAGKNNQRKQEQNFNQKHLSPIEGRAGPDNTARARDANGLRPRPGPFAPWFCFSYIISSSAPISLSMPSATWSIRESSI